MLKTNTQIKKVVLVALFAIFTIPTLVSAGGDNDYGGYYLDGGSGWNGGSSYGTPVSYTDYSYQPIYGGSSYTTPSYGGSNYSSDYGSFGTGYPTYSYGGNTSIPGTTYNANTNSNANKNNNKNKNVNKNKANSTSTSSSSAIAVNNNVNNNNVYVYTNPTGNAVVYNPAHIPLTGYCVITPESAQLGQTVVATAYASGGTGNYTYTWGGDIYSASGASTSFTSYTSGTKTIIVTIRSGSEVATKSCDVTFGNNNQNNDLSAVCYANPTTANVNQLVTWSVNANGGNGNYTYSWSGTDNLSGYGQYVNKIYGYSGTKTAYVTVSSNGRTVTTNCSMNVNGYNGVSYTGSSVNITPNITSGTPVSGVYLSQLPATGLSLGFVEYMVAGMVLVLAAVFAFIFQARKRLMLENA